MAGEPPGRKIRPMNVKRILAGVAAVPLAAGLCLTGGAGAQATTAVTYECQYVVYHDMFFDKPINGTFCAGPVGPATGLVREVSTGKLYSCATLTGTQYSGGVFVFGKPCDLV